MYEVRMLSEGEWLVCAAFKTVSKATQFAEILRNRGERAKVFCGFARRA